jgi:DNA adenine methylase
MVPALITYFGAKYRMADEIIKRFPESFTTYVEPFGGAFGVGLCKVPSLLEVYNDKDPAVYNLWKVVADEDMVDEFLVRLHYVSFDKEAFIACQKRLKAGFYTDRVLWAVDYYYLNKVSFNGVGGFVEGKEARFRKGLDSILMVHERVKNVLFFNRDAIRLISELNESHIFLYIDPPYTLDTRSSGGYRCDLSDKQQRDLILVLQNMKQAKILLSGYDNDLYSAYLSDWYKVTVPVWSQNADGSGKTKYETLWANYPLGK